jgi:hypothetical protein
MFLRKYFMIMFGIVFLVATAAQTKETQDPAASFHDRVVAIYNFLPRNLNQKAIETKSKELDVFWKEVKARGPQGLEELRAELRRSDGPIFFNYDGAKLLLSLSKSPEDRRLALAAINRADLRDIQRDDYFYTIHAFAVEGLDTSEAAMKILDEENFQVFVPQHYLTLGQDYCLVYLLLPTEESFYLEKVERRLFAEKNITAQKSLLTILWYTVTKKGDEAIRRFAADLTQPEKSRSNASHLMEVSQSMAHNPLSETKSSYDSLKAEQKKLVKRISDEALMELDVLQTQLRHKGAQ